MDSVKDAQGTLSETEETVSRFAKFYTPAIILAAAAIGYVQGFGLSLVGLFALTSAPFKGEL